MGLAKWMPAYTMKIHVCRRFYNLFLTNKGSMASFLTVVLMQFGFFIESLNVKLIASKNVRYHSLH